MNSLKHAGESKGFKKKEQEPEAKYLHSQLGQSPKSFLWLFFLLTFYYGKFQTCTEVE